MSAGITIPNAQMYNMMHGTVNRLPDSQAVITNMEDTLEASEGHRSHTRIPISGT